MSLVCVSFDLVFGVGPLVLAHASRVAPGSAKSKDLRPKPVFTPNPFPLAGSRRSASNTVATILLSPPKSLSEGSLAPQQTDRHARRACAGMVRRARGVEIFVPIPCPVPPESDHSCAKRKRPPARWTCPEPLQVWQTITGPPMSPAPLQREHCSERFTVRLVVIPLIASSNESVSGISMSVPRLGCARGGSGSFAEPPPKRSAKMSRKLEPLPAPPPGVVVVLQSNPLKSKPGHVRPAPGVAPRAAASARLSEYCPN